MTNTAQTGKHRTWPFAVLGGVIGAIAVGYPLIYLPMSTNHAQCGKVTLCPKPKEESPEFWRRAMCTQPKYQHLRVCTAPTPETPHD